MPPASLDDPDLDAVLRRLHAHDRSHPGNVFRGMVPFILDKCLGRTPTVTLTSERTRNVALPLNPAAGRFAYLTARAIQARRIVEFGTSFGASTLYLAAAVRDNGGGMVIGSELEPSKVSQARRNITQAGLEDFVDIRAGDGRQTLVDPGGVVDMVLLDGWKDFYLPVLHILEPHLRPGAVVLADNVLFPPSIRKSLAPYVAYVQDKANGFQSVTLTVGSGLEYSVRL